MQTSQYIFNETPKANFGIHDKAFLDREDISGLAKIALLYLLGKPKHWRLRINDIKKKLGCGTSKAYKVLAELRAKGFAVMVRGQQKVEWFFYSKPKPQPAETLANSQSVKVQRVEVCDDLDSIEKSEIIEKPQQHAPEPEPIAAADTHDVVVQDERFEQQTPTACDPEPTPPTATDDTPQAIAGIESKHQAVVKRALSRLTEEQAQAVLVAFTLAVSKSNIRNRTGYLIRLVQSAIDGTFSPVSVSGAAPVLSLDERLRRERERQQEAQERGRMTNDEYAAWLERTYGSVQQADISRPAKGIGLRERLGW